MIASRTRLGRAPRLHGTAALLALGAIVAVAFLAYHFPRSAIRTAMPLLAITSIGVYLTVPDTERVIVVMAVMIIAALVLVRAPVTVPRWALAATAFVIMGTAVLDSAGRAEAIVRAAGCFGVLLVAPVARWRHQLSADGDEHARRPPIAILVVVHCLVVAWSSRALIRVRSLEVVVLGVGAALAIATLVVFATARRAAVPR